MDKEIIQKIATQGVIINFKTNRLIFLELKRILRKNSIKVQILEDTKIDKTNQIIERLSLMTSRALIKSLINKKNKADLKEFLNTPLDLKNYYIKFETDVSME